jgi:hypothetical protein
MWTRHWRVDAARFLDRNRTRPEFAELYGAKESNSAEYRQRTEWNVRDSAATLWIGPTGSPGWRATEWACRGLNKEMFLVMPGKGVKPSDAADWIIRTRIQILNVAGNRESWTPGLGEQAEWFLITAFRIALAMPEKPPPRVQGTKWYPEPF